ncbi:MAG: tRNA preQ1(34) S-adenosylmethionine ribosyltransferase-isomerase QueA [Calditrichaeota bacterium]|nr:tRNA preQ1(34) S-adenosylmethionine ribosyltransferase-isomerase QueA [Calditrichota bacterium]MBT7788259.1 tRNA preQ1(34) S-adenosylmethionine ribosyltransferase-isomerase QueA [Calditrichota bacterium]
MSRLPPELTVDIPDERIAQYPTERRDASRVLIYDSSHKEVIHIGNFPDIVDFLSDELIIRNNTRVIPALVDGKKSGGGAVQVLFLVSNRNFEHESGADRIEVKALINPGRRLKPGLTISLPNGAFYILGEKAPGGKWSGNWTSENGESFSSWLSRAGMSPLPPYIRRKPDGSDLERYQTVYAKQAGSLAAPTAGLHFTDEVLDGLRSRGNQIESVSLDVSLGTFIPIRGDDIAGHDMHTESYDIPEETSQVINREIANQKPITAIGTTVIRTLEGAAEKSIPLKPGRDSTNIFIYPPRKLRVVKKLLTNFHRSDSTLMQLVAAMIGWEGVNITYQTALDNGFRFYSYGDAMLIL